MLISTRAVCLWKGAESGALAPSIPTAAPMYGKVESGFQVMHPFCCPLRAARCEANLVATETTRGPAPLLSALKFLAVLQIDASM